MPAITLHIYTDEGPTTGNVIPAAISIHKDQWCHIVDDAVRPTAAKNCCHLAEFAGDLPVVMQFDAHCEVAPSASRAHLTMLYTVAPGNAALRRRSPVDSPAARPRRVCSEVAARFEGFFFCFAGSAVFGG